MSSHGYLQDSISIPPPSEARVGVVARININRIDL